MPFVVNFVRQLVASVGKRAEPHLLQVTTALLGDFLCSRAETNSVAAILNDNLKAMQALLDLPQGPGRPVGPHRVEEAQEQGELGLDGRGTAAVD